MELCFLHVKILVFLNLVCFVSVNVVAVCIPPCYTFHGDLKRWDKNREMCIQQGGDLVSIETKEEWYFINSEIQKRHTAQNESDEWSIGLRRINQEWKWLSNNQTLTYNDTWRPGKPGTNLQANHVVICKNYPNGIQGLFNNQRNDLRSGGICEYKTGVPNDTSSTNCQQEQPTDKTPYMTIIIVLVVLLIAYVCFTIIMYRWKISKTEGRSPESISKTIETKIKKVFKDDKTRSNRNTKAKKQPGAPTITSTEQLPSTRAPQYVCRSTERINITRDEMDSPIVTYAVVHENTSSGSQTKNQGINGGSDIKPAVESDYETVLGLKVSQADACTKSTKPQSKMDASMREKIKSKRGNRADNKRDGRQGKPVEHGEGEYDEAQVFLLKHPSLEDIVDAEVAMWWKNQQQAVTGEHLHDEVDENKKPTKPPVEIVYAEVDKSKESQQQIGECVYAEVDKNKKSKKTERLKVEYADMAEIDANKALGKKIPPRPPPYLPTKYADIERLKRL